MKKLLILTLNVFLGFQVFSQSPNSFSYQAVLRDVQGNIRSGSPVDIQIDIIQGVQDGLTVYSELFSTITDQFGIVSLQIGNGTLLSGTFSSISWPNGPFFIKTIVDGSEMGTIQLLSVPFALYANKAESFMSGDYNSLFNQPGIPTSLSQLTTDAGNQIISNISTPVDSADAVNKAYVDALIKQIEALQNVVFTVKDKEGNKYKTVLIGDQWWMAENLKATKYQNGDPIQLVTDNTAWANLSSGAYCKYNNDNAISSVYGNTYNYWVAADVRNVCPIDWHVPTKADFQTLVDYLGGQVAAGGKLKEAGITHWLSPNTAATNETGFATLPGGYRSTSGSYGYVSYYGYLWANDSVTPDTATFLVLYYNFPDASVTNDDKNHGFNIRCIKN
jgi:uncharacterized protein (TIGR02145 family)